uniref:Uncharacterized protein n=1 Tax=Hyaloperonospora arabidopsidis (strain Emoy2) TaxID=559515 RepID=M4BEL6_HYAAE
MDVYNSSHPCQRTLALPPTSPVLVDRAVIDDVRVLLLSTKRPIPPSSLLEADCDVWVRYRGAGRNYDRSESADTRSKIYVALWERSHLLVDSSVLMGLHPDFAPTCLTDEVRTFFALWSEYSLARKLQSDVLRLLVKTLDKSLHEAVTTILPSGSAPVRPGALF